LLESSLRGATSLLRAAHDGPELCSLALPLARALLHLPNQYELDGFTEARHGALLALVVRRPEPLARWLCAEFYGSNHTLSMRIDALRVIHAAADELAQPPPAAAPPATAPPQLPPPPEAAAALAPATAGRSRRWASGARPRPAAAASVLGRVAPLFFFPLMARYDDPANTFQLLGEDCFLLQAPSAPSPTLRPCAPALPPPPPAPRPPPPVPRAATFFPSTFFPSPPSALPHRRPATPAAGAPQRARRAAPRCRRLPVRAAHGARAVGARVVTAPPP
jgi:hypothetical protein